MNTSVVHTRGPAYQLPTSPRRQLPTWSGLKSHRPTCPLHQTPQRPAFVPFSWERKVPTFPRGLRWHQLSHCPFVGGATCLQRAPRLPGAAPASSPSQTLSSDSRARLLHLELPSWPTVETTGRISGSAPMPPPLMPLPPLPCCPVSPEDSVTSSHFQPHPAKAARLPKPSTTPLGHRALTLGEWGPGITPNPSQPQAS